MFGVKDSVIIAISNEQGIFNTATLERVNRITEKVAELPGVLAQRKLDVASLSTASVFRGTEEAVMNEPLMDVVPQTEAELLHGRWAVLRRGKKTLAVAERVTQAEDARPTR